MSGVSSGQRGRGAWSIGLAAPSRRRSIPAQATITALSVHSRTGGAAARTPRRPPPAATPRAPPRSPPRRRPPPAAAPPVAPRIIAMACAARSASTSATARWKLAAMSAATAPGNAPAAQPRHHLRHRRLQAGEAEIAPRPPQHRPRQSVARRIAARRQPLQRRAARPAQPEHFGHLVEGLAGGVVHGAAQADIAADALHRHALAMAAGDQQQQIGKRRAALHQSGQPRGQRVRLQVVDRDVGQAVRQGDALGDLAADDQPADQPRPGAGRHPAQVARTPARPRAITPRTRSGSRARWARAAISGTTPP